MKLAVATLSVLLALLAGCGDDHEEPAGTQPEQVTTAADEEPAGTQPEQETTGADEAPPPKNRAQALEEFIRLSYQLAVAEADTKGQFNDEGKDFLRDADKAWQEYVARVRRPKAAIARMMVQAYGPAGLDEPANAGEAAEVVARIEPSPQAYLVLVQHAARAGQTRKADLAGKKAVELAPSRNRAQIRQLVEQAKLTPTP